MKKGTKVKIDMEAMKRRFGKSAVDYGELEFIEMYSENRGTAHFKTEKGEIITLKVREVVEI